MDLGTTNKDELRAAVLDAVKTVADVRPLEFGKFGRTGDIHSRFVGHIHSHTTHTYKSHMEEHGGVFIVLLQWKSGFVRRATATEGFLNRDPALVDALHIDDGGRGRGPDEGKPHFVYFFGSPEAPPRNFDPKRKGDGASVDSGLDDDESSSSASSVSGEGVCGKCGETAVLHEDGYCNDIFSCGAHKGGCSDDCPACDKHQKDEGGYSLRDPDDDDEPDS